MPPPQAAGYHMAERILVFPACLPEAALFAQTARLRGAHLIGASSLSSDPARADYADWVQLPYVYENQFAAELGTAVAEYAVTGVFSSHEVVRHRLSVLLPEVCPGVVLLGRPPRVRHNGPSHAELVALAAGLGSPAEALVGPAELDAVLERALAMRGQSSLGKLACFLALAPSLPNGDLVEIGALAGRSAFVLGWLGRRYGVGPLLAMDPWSQAAAMQHDSPQALLDSTQALDFGMIFAEFLENLVPCFYGTANYLREEAAEVRPRYGAGFAVGPTEFGVTRYTGRLALLHVDGNHDFAAVSRDVAEWLPLLQAGGWAVLDDYNWPFGDGPRRVGDELLEAGGWQRAFTCDGALFLQR